MPQATNRLLALNAESAANEELSDRNKATYKFHQTMIWREPA